jgi:hypothetical protein
MQSEPASSRLLNFTKHGVHVVPDLDAKHSWPSLTKCRLQPCNRSELRARGLRPCDRRNGPLGHESSEKN